MALATQVGGREVASRDGALDWCAQYRLDPDAPWSECLIVEVSLTGARLAFADDRASEITLGEQCSLQISSIAGDDVGIVMRAVVRSCERGPDGETLVDIEFSARREESLLLHLLVRLRTLV